MEFHLIFAIYVAILSAITFIVYIVDKILAKIDAWRVPEKVLLGLSLVGGAIGGLVAMLIVRHKTKHWYFYLLNVLGIILHVGAFLLLALPL